MTALSEITNITVRVQRLMENLEAAVAAARDEGATWAEIGEAAGVSAQAAHQRWTQTSKDRDRRVKAELREGAGIATKHGLRRLESLLELGLTEHERSQR